MPSITSLNFNDLPEEVHKTFFDLFNPIERTLVLPTCKKWYDLIIETKAYWKEVEIDHEDSSMEKIKTILQVFSSRSGNALTKVRINRLIETEEELQEIFSSIQSSTSSIKTLLLRQSSTLNSKTRGLARSMPRLRMLLSSESRSTASATASTNNLIVNKTSSLQHLQTDILDDFQEREEVEWLSRLEVLIIGTVQSKGCLRSILQSCRSNLRHLGLGQYGWEDNRETDLSDSLQPIEIDTLKMLKIAICANFSSKVSLPFIAPNLETLSCSLEVVQAVDESSSLTMVWLLLRDESEGEGRWGEREGDRIIQLFQSSFHHRSSVRFLLLEETSDKTQIQFQSILQALLIPSGNPEGQILLPNLSHLFIKDIDESFNFEPLARTAISREKYRFDLTMSDYPQDDTAAVEEGSEKTFTDAEEEKKYLWAENTELRAKQANLEAQNLRLKAELMEKCFIVEIESEDPDMKNRLMGIYLETKKRLQRVELEE